MAQVSVPKDPSSYANFDEITISHLDLDLKVDFDAEKLCGSAILHCEALKPTKQLILDSRDLQVEKVISPGHVLNHHSEDEALGQKIIIDLAEDLKSGNKM